MKAQHIGLYSNPLGRFYGYLRGGFWDVAELAIFDDERSRAAEELTWVWDELLWTYWDPRATRRKVRALERRLLGAYETLGEDGRTTFRRKVLLALSGPEPPCYTKAVLELVFGPSLSFPLDSSVPIKDLDTIRLMARKEYRLLLAEEEGECPCMLLGKGGLFDMLERFYHYVGYRTSAAPPLGRPNPVVSLFDVDLDVFDVALVERSISGLCQRVPTVYRDELLSRASKLYQSFPSAMLEELIDELTW